MNFSQVFFQYALFALFVQVLILGSKKPTERLHEPRFQATVNPACKGDFYTLQKTASLKYLITTIAAVVLVGRGPSAPDISIYEAAVLRNIEAINQNLAAGTHVYAKDEKYYSHLKQF